MIKKLLSLLFVVFLASCASNSIDSNNRSDLERSGNYKTILDTALSDSSDEAKVILETSMGMMDINEIVVGGCWNYVNRVYDKAGFKSKERNVVYKSKFKGPYFDSDKIRPGDWLYFVNHTYSDSEHSAIFIGWTDEMKKEAVMFSYVGGNKRVPATLKKFTLDKVYNVTRASE